MFELAWFGTRRIIFFGCTSTVVAPIVERLRRDTERVEEVRMTQPVPDHPIMAISIRLRGDGALVEVGAEEGRGGDAAGCRAVVSDALTSLLEEVDAMRAVAYGAVSEEDRAAVDRRRALECEMEASWSVSHPEQLPFMTLEETARRVYNQEDRVPHLWFPRQEWASIVRTTVANLIVSETK